MYHSESGKWSGAAAVADSLQHRNPAVPPAGKGKMMQTTPSTGFACGGRALTPKPPSRGQTAWRTRSIGLRARSLGVFFVVMILASLATSRVQAQFYTVAPFGPSGYASDAVF